MKIGCFHVSACKFVFYYTTMMVFACFSCKNDPEKDMVIPEKDDADSLVIEELSAEIRENPRNDALFAQRAKQYFTMGKTGDAINDLEIALKLDSANTQYYNLLADYYMSLGKSGKAKTALEKCINIDPENTGALIKLAQIYFYVEYFREALEYLRKAQMVDENIPQIYFIKALAYKEMEDTVNALKNLMIAVEKDPEYYSAYVILGSLHTERGDSIAADFYNNALRLEPLSYEANYMLAFHYQERGKLQKAMDHYWKIINKIDSTAKKPWYNLGYIHLEHLKEYGKAIEYFSKAVELDSTWVEAYHNLGYTYSLMGNEQQARKYYNIALDLRPNYELSVEGLNRLDEKYRR